MTQTVLFNFLQLYPVLSCMHCVLMTFTASTLAKPPLAKQI